MKTPVALLVSLGCWWTLLCPMAPNAQVSSNLEGLIRSEVEEEKIPSLAFAIVNRDSVLQSGAYGYADSEFGTLATEQTLYMLSSISKLFVAVAVMQLQEKGDIELDRDLNEYLSFDVRHSEYPEVPITPRLLLTHRAGLANPGLTQLPEYYAMAPGEELPSHLPWLRDVLTPGHREYVPELWLSHHPGTQIKSSNLGVTLLAHLVEVVSSEPFATYAKRHIFEPLGMDNTSYAKADLDRTQIAALYLRTGDAMRRVNMRAFAPGIARSSVEDLALFVRAMLNNGTLEGKQLLRAATIDQMLYVEYPDAGLAFGSGLGLIWRAYGDKNAWLGHTGGGGVVTASLDLHREAGVGVILLTNAGRKRTVSPGGWVYQRLHREALDAKED